MVNEVGSIFDGDDMSTTIYSSPPAHDQEKAIYRFYLYCKAFYNSSLMIKNSSSDRHQNSAFEGSDATINFSHGKIVIDTINCISAIRAAIQNYHDKSTDQLEVFNESLADLYQVHALNAKCHYDLLKECGLSDISCFIPTSHSLFNGEQGEEASLFEIYVQVRDATRRRSHRLAMLQRQTSLLHVFDQTEREKNINSLLIPDWSHLSKNPSHPLTQSHNVKSIIVKIQTFVKKYRSKIGSHPFLAGLHRILYLQVHPQDSEKENNSDPTYIVEWKFCGTVLTEACHSDGTGATEAYVRDAAGILFSFMIWIKDIDIESRRTISLNEGDQFDNDFSIWNKIIDQHSERETDPFFSFQVNKYISNVNLLRLLAVLPNPNGLDARATGSITILSSSKAQNVVSKEVEPRVNVDGHLDQAWPWHYTWQLCNLL